MTRHLGEPDLALSLRLDLHAPSEARHAVGRVGRPSPDLRDAVRLLASELVTRALRHNLRSETPTVALRVWMTSDLVRVELWTPPDLLHGPLDSPGAEFDLMLLEETTDRWAIEEHAGRSCAWFEIDRHAQVAQRNGLSEQLPAAGRAGP